MPATMLSSSNLGVCGAAQAKDRLVAAGLKPTRQRVALCKMLFEDPPRHVTWKHRTARRRMPGTVCRW